MSITDTQLGEVESPLLREYLERRPSMPQIPLADESDDRYIVGETLFHMRSKEPATIVGVDRHEETGETIYVLRYVDALRGSVRYFAGEMGDTWTRYALASGRR